MSEFIESQRTINLRKNQKNRSTIQLTFHIPESMRARTEVIVEVRTLADIITSGNVKKIVEAETSNAIEPLDAVGGAKNEEIKNTESVASYTISAAEFTPEIVSQNETLSIVSEVQIQADEIPIEIFPYFSLNLANQPSVYKIGTSFLKDISLGKKQFGFATLSKKTDDLHLLVYGSFINYSLKQPVLIVVRDLNDKSLDKYRSNFTEGTLWKWKTCDWGNVCFVDYKQVIEHSEEFQHVDLSFITHEFAAVLWALPSVNIQHELQKASLAILAKINSATFIVSKGGTKNKDLQKSAAYYQCFDIAVKGILVEEE